MREQPYRDRRGVAKFRHEVLAVVLKVDADYDGLDVLLRRRPRAPFEGKWALPSGPIEVNESAEQAIDRHLALPLAHREQLATFSDPARDPFERTIATAYLGLVPEDTDPGTDTWVELDEAIGMAFDHDLVIEAGVERLRGKVSYTNIAFALAPPEFTMTTLRRIYRCALGHDIDVSNLGRVLRRRGQIEPTGNSAGSGEHGGRPASTWRFSVAHFEVTDSFAMLGPGRKG